MTVILKKHHSSDFEYIFELTKNEIGRHHPNRNFTDKELKKRLKKNKTFVIYKEDKKSKKGKRIGFVTYRINHGSFLFLKKRMMLDLIALEPKEQHSGLGGEVVQWLEEYARNSKLHSIYGYVLSKNKQALNAWKKYGYQITGKRPYHYILEKAVKKGKEDFQKNEMESIENQDHVVKDKQ